MPVDPAVIGPATLTLTQAIGSFQAFLPKFTEISAANPADNPQLVRDVRMGEFGAVVLTLGIGGMTSAMVGSPVPANIALITSLGLVLLYESALRSNPERINSRA